MLAEKFGKYSDYGVLFVRIVLGLTLLTHGYDKLFVAGPAAVGTGFFTNIGIPAPVLMAWVVSLVEFVGGAFILLGFLTRITAFVVAIQFIVIVLMKIFPTGLKPETLKFASVELDLLILAASVMFLVGSKTRYSLENMIFKKEII